MRRQIKARRLLDYSVPRRIKRAIPDYFYLALGGELVSVCGRHVLERDEYGEYTFHWLIGTSGYHVALKATCAKLGMEWLSDYRDSLEWYESDGLDSELLEGMLRQFELGGGANAYYRYLLERERKAH